MNEQARDACEREPIHIPGAIQSHGLFFALQEPDLTIAHISANTQEFLGAPAASFLGRPLQDMLSPESARVLESVLNSGRLEAANPMAIKIQTAEKQLDFEGIVHRLQGLLVLELEPRQGDEDLSFITFYHAVQHSMSRLEKANTAELALQISAEEVARLTSFARVMVYQFDEEWHGKVVAEALHTGMDSYLGLHFPSSDIPAQARRLYSLNSLRLIADVAYTPAPIIPSIQQPGGTPLDLSHSTLRSVSPVHLEYLRNMGVFASMSISIMEEDRLWGLLACHHSSPHFVSFQARSACRFIGQLVSQQLHTIQARQQSQQRAILREKLAKIRLHFQERGLLKALEMLGSDLLDIVGAGGAAFNLQGSWQRFGEGPEPQQLDALQTYLQLRAPGDVFSTDHLARVYGPAEDYFEKASGLLAVPLANSGAYLLWFRPEIVRTVYWAGEPEKVEDPISNRLHPRTSFASWKEVQRQRSAPWDKGVVEAAADLRMLIVSEELERLNSELKRSNAELDEFASIASHDLKEPLRGMRNYAQFVAIDEGPKLSIASQERLQTIQKLGEKTELLIDGLYQYSRLGRLALARQETDLNELLSDVILRLQALFTERGVRLIKAEPLPRVICDRHKVGEVFYNLLLNAAKYNDKEDKWVTVGCRQEKFRNKESLVFFIQDNGIGIPANQQKRIFSIFKRGLGSEKFGKGTGTGLTIARRIVETHGGHLWLESAPGEGTIFFWTLSS